MSNEMVKNSGQVPAVGGAPTPGEEILSSAIVLPRLLIMQGLSEAVAKRQKSPTGEAIAQGDIVRSTTLEKLGDPDKPVLFIPVTFTNEWILQEEIGDKFEFRGREPLNAGNQDLPWQFEKDGSRWKRVKSCNVFSLLPGDIAAEQAEMEKATKGEAADPDKALLPVVITFRSTGYQAGMFVQTHFAKARKFKQEGYVSILKLTAEQTENDRGIFYIPKVSTHGPSDKAAREAAEYWRGVLATKAVQVAAAEEDEVNETESTQRRQAQGRAASRI